jgi:hypothetical protein
VLGGEARDLGGVDDGAGPGERLQRVGSEAEAIGQGDADGF